MRHPRIAPAAAVLAVLALSATACSTKSGTGASNAGNDGVMTGPGVTDTIITLGALTDLTGPYASLSKSIVNAQHTGRPVPWLPLLEVFAAARGLLRFDLRADRRLGVLSSVLPELADLLPACDRPEPGHERLLIMRAMRSALGLVGPAGVVVVEDAQWIDRESQELLRWLLASPPAGFRLVVMYRPEELATPGCPLGVPGRPRAPQLTEAVVRLGPLDADAVAELAGSLGHPCVDGLAGRLTESTGGVPGVLEEVLRPGCDRNIPPAGLSALVAGRMAQLTGPALAVARAAAVLGEPAGEAELARVAGLPPPRARRALLTALRSAVIVEHADGRYGYRSPLATQAGYALLPGPWRRQMHHRALQALGERLVPASLAVLARHSRCAGHTDDWLRLAEAAAEQSMMAGDTDSTIGLLHDLLAEPGLLPPARDRFAVRLSAVACTALRSERSLTAAPRPSRQAATGGRSRRTAPERRGGPDQPAGPDR